MSAQRIEQLEAMRAARTNGEGKPKVGYGKNVAAIAAEIRRLKSTTNLVEPTGP